MNKLFLKLESFAEIAMEVVRKAIAHKTAAIVLMILLIVSGKLLLIGVLGSPVPYYDQWLAEAKFLYIPYLNSDLQISDMFIVHNEHHIVFTKILSLLYLEIAGNWNPIFQMIFNIPLHIGCILGFVYIFRVQYLGKNGFLLTLMTAVLFFVPFDSDNTLWGFQSQFYFVIGLSLFAVPVAARTEAFSFAWIAALVLGSISFFAMGAGIGVVLAIALLALLQIIVGARARSLKEFCGIAAFLVAAFLMLPDHANTGAANIGQFIWGFGLAAGWPVPLPVIGVFVVNIPALILLVTLIRDKSPKQAIGWAVIALLFWVGLQAALISYARPGGTVTARYFDIYAFTPLLNMIALILVIGQRADRKSPLLAAVAIGWFCLIPASLTFYAAKFMPVEVSMDVPMVAARDENFSKFVQTLEPDVLRKPFQEIPFDDSSVLIDLASRPEILGILPDRFGAAPENRQIMRQRLFLGGGLNADPDLLKTIAFWGGTALLAFCLSLLGLAIIVRSSTIGNIVPVKPGNGG